MKILVAIKQVPVRDSRLRPDASGRWIDESDLSFEINEPDAYALEEALQLKEKHGGEVVALCAGPSRAQSSIREALAKGDGWDPTPRLLKPRYRRRYCPAVYY